MKNQWIGRIIKLTILLMFTSFILFFTNSCNIREKKRKNERNELVKKMKDEYILQKMKIEREYNVTLDWDTLDFNYSYEYKDCFVDNNLLIVNPDLHDIFYKDSLIYASVIKNPPEPFNDYYLRSSAKFFIELKVSKKLLKQIMSIEKKEIDFNTMDRYLFYYDYFDPIFYVVKINNVNKYAFNIESFIEPPDYFDFDLELSNTFFCEGELIAIINPDSSRMN